MSTQANPWVGKNFIPENPRMEVPPPYFMQRIWDQDAMLVVLPSRKVPFAYVIARRKQWGPGLTVAAIDEQFANPDTKMCVQHGCVPVCLMYKTGISWNPDPIIKSLQARDLWTHGGQGGPDCVADMLDAQDEAAAQKIRDETRDDLWNRSGDAWRSYQHRTGQSSLGNGRTSAPKPRQGRRIFSNSPLTSESTAGLGSVFVNRE